MRPIIYLDNAATTAVAANVRAAMEPYLDNIYGNPSSVHQAGREAKAAIERAREQVARALQATTNEIVFTSGGTEADNAAVIGAALARQEQGKHIVTTSMEHHAVLNTCEFLEQLGFDVTYVDPDERGIVTVDAIEKALRPDTQVVSVMLVNNETGAIQPIAEIGALVRERGIVMHTDAVQALGLLELNVAELNVDLLSISAHKVHGPKGVGALYVHHNLKWTPYLHGGQQERKRRAGTENLPGIVGMGEAVRHAVAEREAKFTQICELRDAMLTRFATELDPALYVLNSLEVGESLSGDGLPSILNVSFTNVAAERLLMNLDMQGIAASSGSACTAGALQPSHVLTAMGLPLERVLSAIRFSFSGYNTVDEVTEAARKTVEVVKRLQR
ncbi:cysteine desulfurase family protein [Tumebacillus permanentifrigoris]|uniref:cysteine desulfurase n=1 Tax=Tumebacillus permanentifrigoris TaxID=378543 RepID=A0A316D2S7_9BACL|nr:cysteine desulfurase family protein [Tumebacillus permanentifrigoris]PWK05113.1 cysteine desulfurase [Tumebacillus permanentifrigoris]